MAAGALFLFKTVTITTNATVANRFLQEGSTVPSSKTVAASLANQDMLDREFAAIASTVISVANGQAGDTWVITAVQLV